jgi:hypothetical protein
VPGCFAQRLKKLIKHQAAKGSTRNPNPNRTEMNKPKTEIEWHAYRAVLSCQLGIQAIEGKRDIPAGTTATEWGIYNLLHAVESLAKIHLPKEEPATK